MTDTMFKPGDIVKSLTDNQGLNKGETYQIAEGTAIIPTPMGNVVKYFVTGHDGKSYAVTNGHLILKKVEPALRLVIDIVVVGDVTMTKDQVAEGIENVANRLKDEQLNDPGWKVMSDILAHRGEIVGHVIVTDQDYLE